MLYQYKLTGQIEIWSRVDAGGSYEAYGSLSIDFGSMTFNKGISIWHVTTADYLDVPNKNSAIINIERIFPEVKDFGNSGNITLHGSIWEDDATGDDLLGNYEGVEISANCLFDKEIINTYIGAGGIDDAYVKLKLMISKVSNQQS